jgi:deazaflavin-dependent oxidoreductase (nitroreductase family)
MVHLQALEGTKVPRIVPILHPLIRRLIGAGLPLGPNVLLTVRGRTSGLPRTFPIAIMESGGRRFVQSPYGEVNWVRNLRADGEAVITRGHHSEEVDAVELTPEEAGPLLRDAVAPLMRNRLTAAFARLFIPIRRGAAPGEYVEHVRRHPMFELRGRSGT